MGNPRSPRKSTFWLWLSLAVLFLIGAINLFALVFVIPKFEQIFQDALPGQPLPALTIFIISTRFVLALLVGGWLVFCSVMTLRRSPRAILLINLGVIWAFLQIAAIVYAMFMPMVGTISGMSTA